MATVRICVCGDEGTGKSSLITSLVKDVFVTGKIQPVLPSVTLPPTLGTPDNVTTVIVDTSALPHERANLQKELRKCNVILLVYSDHYSYERIALFWMPYFRSQGVNVPVVLCSNKSDLVSNGPATQVIEDVLPLIAEFKEIDSSLRTSARDHYNVNEVFYLCQKAVTHPVAPLYDAKEVTLKPAAVTALQRIFYLCDKDQDGVLNNDEVRAFQSKVFEKTLSDDELVNIKRSIQPDDSPTTDPPPDVDLPAFIRLMTLYVQKGRHETIWMILRKFHYTDSLSLAPSFLTPKFDIPQGSSVELSPTGYRFFADLFLLFDKDSDGGLSPADVDALFAPTPGVPDLWLECGFPACTVRNDAGHVTLQGWLAQWSMTTFEAPHTTLAYLAWLGFETNERGGTTTALKVTPARRRPKPSAAKKRLKPEKIQRNVFLCYVLGASHAGKSALLSAFLNRPFSPTYHPTIAPLVAVNSVELPGGKQVYLILRELGAQEPAVLAHAARLAAADVLCLAYDSSDADSFAHVAALRARHPHVAAAPAVLAATKADRDKAVQAGVELQPDAYASASAGAATAKTTQGAAAAAGGAPLPLPLPEPRHVSVRWASIQELFVHLAECAADPAAALPALPDDERPDRSPVYIALGATVCAAVAAAIIWRKNYAAASAASGA